MKKLVVLVLLALFAATVPALAQTEEEIDDGISFRCLDQRDDVRPLSVEVDGAPAIGQYAVPTEPADTLVVFGHGYGHISDSWVGHMKRAAADHGVIAVTMDYRGSYKDSAGNNRGWFVKEGAEDMIAATHLFQDSCPTITETVIFGVSMGGNSTGLAVAGAADEVNAQGGPLFDYWFNIEGAVNVVETYAGASVLAPANGFAANAKADIEDEMNGTFQDDPEGYADLAVVNHVGQIADSGVRGVVMVHAIEDGLVPYNQAREFIPLLLNEGLRVEMYTAASKGDGEGGTTATGYIPNKPQESPFAGHASETSTTHIVMRTALDRLWSLIDDDVPVADYADILVDTQGTLPLI
jgi:Prolyl oligopeptidase family